MDQETTAEFLRSLGRTSFLPWVNLEWILEFGSHVSSKGQALQKFLKWAEQQNQVKKRRPISPESYFGLIRLKKRLVEINSLPVVFHNPNLDCAERDPPHFEGPEPMSSYLNPNPPIGMATTPHSSMEIMTTQASYGILIGKLILATPARVGVSEVDSCGAAGQLFFSQPPSPYTNPPFSSPALNPKYFLPVSFILFAAPFQAVDNVWVVLHDWFVLWNSATGPLLTVASLPVFLKGADPFSDMALKITPESKPFCQVKSSVLLEMSTAKSTLDFGTNSLVALLRAKSPLFWNGKEFKFFLQVQFIASFEGELLDRAWYIEITDAKYASFYAGFIVGHYFGFHDLQRKEQTFCLVNSGSINSLFFIRPVKNNFLDICISEVVHAGLGLYMTDRGVLLCLGTDPTYYTYGYLPPMTKLRINNFHQHSLPNNFTVSSGKIMFPCTYSNWALLKIGDCSCEISETLSLSQKSLPATGILLLYHFFNAVNPSCPPTFHGFLFDVLSKLIFESLDKNRTRQPIEEFLLHENACPGGNITFFYQVPTLELYDSFDWEMNETKYLDGAPLLGWLDVKDGMWMFNLCSSVLIPCLIVTPSGLPTSLVCPPLVRSLWYIPQYFVTRDNHHFHSGYLLYLPLNRATCLLAPKFSSNIHILVPTWQVNLITKVLTSPLEGVFISASFPREVDKELRLIPGIPVPVWTSWGPAGELKLDTSNEFEAISEPCHRNTISRFLEFLDNGLANDLPDVATSFQSVHEALNSIPHPRMTSCKDSFNINCYGVVRSFSILEEDKTWFLGPCCENTPIQSKLHIVLEDTSCPSTLSVYLPHTDDVMRYLFSGQLLTLCSMATRPSKSGKAYGIFNSFSRLYVGLPPNTTLKSHVPRYLSSSTFPIESDQRLTDIISIPFRYLTEFHQLPHSEDFVPPRGVHRVTAKITRVATLTFKYSSIEAKEMSGFMVAYISDGSCGPTRAIVDDLPTIFSLLKPGVPCDAVPTLLEEMVAKLYPEFFHYYQFDAPADSTFNLLDNDDPTLAHFSKKLLRALRRINSSVSTTAEMWDLAVEPRYPIRDLSEFQSFLDPTDSQSSNADVHPSLKIAPEIKLLFSQLHHP